MGVVPDIHEAASEPGNCGLPLGAIAERGARHPVDATHRSDYARNGSLHKETTMRYLWLVLTCILTIAILNGFPILWDLTRNLGTASRLDLAGLALLGFALMPLVFSLFMVFPEKVRTGGMPVFTAFASVIAGEAAASHLHAAGIWTQIIVNVIWTPTIIALFIVCDKNLAINRVASRIAILLTAAAVYVLTFAYSYYFGAASLPAP